ncbi:MAG TPA: DUF4340 domain-containing protein [Vicinamibacterales bacterium]|nr:DUF4340 domain-containing protein [Vicinamibacterales bacterium]
MRRFASTIALVLVLAGLVGYIYFVDSKEDPGSSDREKVFGTVTADEIEEIQVKSADGENSRLQKSDGKWQLVEPVKAAADEGEASSLASSLASLEVNRVVDENAAALAEYGLEPARLEVAFKKKGDANEQRVLIGEKTPTGGDLYARAKDSKRVFLIPAYLDASFNKNTFALRDRRILSFDRNAVDGLAVTSGSNKVQLTKTGSEWRLSSPIAARADFAAVEGALERLSSTQMQGIVDQEGGNLAKYGLTKPTGSIVVAAGSTRATLTLGSTDNSLLFARDGSRPMVFTVAPVLKDDVIRSVGDFRRKDLFDARAFTATRVELKRGAETVTLEKSKGEKGDVWRAAGKDVESGKADDLLTKLTGLRAQSYDAQAHASLKTPALVVTIGFDEKKQETVTFGRSQKDVYASRSDEPGAAKLEASGLDEVIKALDALK